MREVVVVIKNEPGLHTRPASMFASLASRFTSRITLSDGGDPVDAKSIMGILMLAAITGTHLTIAADGPDESEAVTALERLVDSAFDGDVLETEKQRAMELG